MKIIKKKIKIIKEIILCSLSIVIICVTCVSLERKLHHAYMVDRVVAGIHNGYTVQINDEKISNIASMVIPTSEISEYNIYVDDKNKLINLK